MDTGARAPCAESSSDTLLTVLTTKRLTTTDETEAQQATELAADVTNAVVVFARMLEEAGVNGVAAQELAAQFPAERIAEVIGMCRLEATDNPGGFIRDALLKGWVPSASQRAKTLDAAQRAERARQVKLAAVAEQRTAQVLDERTAERTAWLARLRRELAALTPDEFRERVERQIEIEPDDFWKLRWRKTLSTVRSAEDLPEYLLPPLHGQFPTAGRQDMEAL